MIANSNFYALLIGINNYLDETLKPLKYPIKDCHDLQSILTDEQIGCFPPEHVQILLEEQATTKKVREALHAFVRNRGPEDTVLLYFSGHGFFGGSEGKEYLASFDVSRDYLNTVPEEGIEMDFIHDKIFMDSRARNVVLIIDCCYSGSLIPRTTYRKEENSPRGRYAILSSSPTEESVESESCSNSEFTFHLINGLRGLARNDIGEVTTDRLTDYLRTKAPNIVSYGQTFSQIVLSFPGPPPNARILVLPKISMAEEILTDLNNPLEPYMNLIRELTDTFQQINERRGNSNIEQIIFETIQEVTSTDLIIRLQMIKPGDTDEGDEWSFVVSESKLSSDENERLVNQVTPIIFNVANSDSIFDSSNHGKFHIIETTSGNKVLLIIPLLKSNFKGCLVLCGIPNEQIFMQDAFGNIILNFYSLLKEGRWNLDFLNNVELLEASLYDEMKNTYGFVPTNIYNRRFELLQKRKGEMKIWYQPIVRLDEDAKLIKIDSWEALARDEKTGKTPVDLFKAAELWGRKFQVELDIYFLKLAVSTYASLLSKTKFMQRVDDIKELSVNVYPETLMRTSYYNALNEILFKKKSESGRTISGYDLVLELSEKTNIPGDHRGDTNQSGLEEFEKRLTDLNKKFHIKFSLDDFGVENASISRLATLKLINYIKLDQDIPKQENADLTIDYVVSLVRRRSLLHKIVQEGVDKFCRVNLHDMFHKGNLGYIQGFIVAEAGPDLFRLEDHICKDLSDRVNGIIR